MANEADDYAQRKHAQDMDERKSLIEAARDSAKTFDQAVLAFGSAIFGASIAFLKDVAPHPQNFSLKWLALSWSGFSTGLLAALLSFLFSHRACMFEVEKLSVDGTKEAKKNRWSDWTDWCNYSCVVLLFLGLVFWSIFAVENLKQGEGSMSSPKPPQRQKEDRGYVPPPPAKAPPPSPPPSPPQNAPPPKK